MLLGYPHKPWQISGIADKRQAGSERRYPVNIFKKSQLNHLRRHDSLLHELALTTMAEHSPQALDTTPQRRCQTCNNPWPCPGYQLAQAAEAQARGFKNKLISP
jgi:hypothetical protein